MVKPSEIENFHFQLYKDVYPLKATQWKELKEFLKETKFHILGEHIVSVLPEIEDEWDTQRVPISYLINGQQDIKFKSLNFNRGDKTLASQIKSGELTDRTFNSVVCYYLYTFFEQVDQKKKIEKDLQEIEEFLRVFVSQRNDYPKIIAKIINKAIESSSIAKNWKVKIEIDGDWKCSFLDTNSDQAFEDTSDIDNNLPFDKSFNSSNENSVSENSKTEIQQQVRKNPNPTDNHTNKKIRYFIWSSGILAILIIIILTAAYFIKLNAEKEHIRNITETANTISSNRTSLLSNLFKDINEELESDYNSDQKRNLSQTTISRIIALSNRFEPYLYFRGSKIIEHPLSKERAELFISLLDMDLDHDTFVEVIGKGNFSYSDFFNVNLSNLKLTTKAVFLYGNYEYDAFLMISTMERPNLTYSDFTGANLTKAVIYGNLKGSNFSKAILKETFFAGSDLSDTNFMNNLIISEFYGCDIKNARFEKSELYTVFFHGDLRGAVFDGSTINNYEDYFDKHGLKSSGPIFTTSAHPISKNTFHNVFFSSDSLVNDFHFKFDGLTYAYGLAGKEKSQVKVSEFAKFHRSNRGEIVEKEILKPFLLRNDELIVDENFDEPWSLEMQKVFIEKWKNNPESLSYYIVRTNDHYIHDDEKYYQSRTVQSKYGYHYFEYDTVKVTSDRFRHYYHENNNYFHHHPFVCKPYFIPSNTKSASFKNCIFNNTLFTTKISNVSFKGSRFNDVDFNISQLYNLDFSDTKGIFNLMEYAVFDSIIINRDSDLFHLASTRDSLLNKKFRLYNKPFTLNDHLDSLERQTNSDYRLGYYLGHEIGDTFNRLKALDSLNKRMKLVELGDGEFYILDKHYQDKVKKLDELESKEK